MAQDYDTTRCYTCDRTTAHGVRYMSKVSFVGKLLVRRDCGETIKQPLGGSEAGCCN